jgi:hypothetical protein
VTSVTDHYDPVPDLAALIWAAAYGERSATRRAEALLPRLGIGEDAGTGAIEAGLRKALGLPGAQHAEAQGKTGECERIGGCLAEIGARTQPNSEPALWRCGSCGRIPWDIPADIAAIPWGESR